MRYGAPSDPHTQASARTSRPDRDRRRDSAAADRAAGAGRCRRRAASSATSVSSALLLYHGTTRRSAEQIAIEGFAPRRPSRRVWFAQSKGYALRRAKVKARRSRDRPVVLLCELDLAALRRKLGIKSAGEENSPARNPLPTGRSRWTCWEILPGRHTDVCVGMVAAVGHDLRGPGHDRTSRNGSSSKAAPLQPRHTLTHRYASANTNTRSLQRLKDGQMVSPSDLCNQRLHAGGFR